MGYKVACAFVGRSTSAGNVQLFLHELHGQHGLNILELDVSLNVITVILTHSFFMAALWNRVGHYIFVLLFLHLLSFFRTAVGDWMSTILPHMMWP